MMVSEPGRHAVVIPIFGEISEECVDYLRALEARGLMVIVVDNNDDSLSVKRSLRGNFVYLQNRNLGGIAGGLNRGVELARQHEVAWITLLDQDSRINPDEYSVLLEAFGSDSGSRLLVGPSIWDDQRQQRHGLWDPATFPLQKTKVLISSGITFRMEDWPLLGAFQEELFIDFVDYAWCFRARARGFELLQHAGVSLKQQFGVPHPNRLCRGLGLQLYSPMRHYYGLRNLRWLCLQPYIPLDLKIKESLKMLIKPWLWIVFEPQRRSNLKAIWAGLTGPLPRPDS